MISSQTYSNRKQQKLIPYLCKFQLTLHQLQIQLYYPSSYQIVWKTKSNQILSSTTFKLKQNNNIVKIDQVLQGQTVMLYNKQTKNYVDKDTFIYVNYVLNSKPNEVKQLGRLTLKMNRFMDENGQSTLRKGVDNQNINGQTLNNISSVTMLNNNRNDQTPIYNRSNTNSQSQLISANNTNKKVIVKKNNNSKGVSEDFRCLRLQESVYNAKIKFKCILIQSIVSKIMLRSLPVEDFNQNFMNLNGVEGNNNTENNGKGLFDQKAKTTNKAQRNTYQKQSPRTSSQYQQNTQKSISRQKPKQPVNKLTPHFNLNSQSQNRIINSPRKQPPQYFKSTHNNKLNNSSPRTIQQPGLIDQLHLIKRQQQCKQQQQKNLLILRQLQLLQKQNELLNRTIKQMRIQFQDLEDELKEKENYFHGNWEKLEQMDHLKFQYLELREYTEKLEYRLIKKYAEKPESFKIWNLNNGNGNVESIANLDKDQRQSLASSKAEGDDYVRMSTFTLGMNESSGLKQSKNLIKSSQSIMRTSFKNKNRDSGLDSDLMLTPSQIHLTNSQMKQVQGSTVRMQKQLSFIQIQLQQIKAELNLIKQKYEYQCHNHLQTKTQLFQTREKHSTLEQEFQLIKQTLNQFMIQKQRLQNQMIQKKKIEHQINNQLFKTKEAKYQSQYQLNLVIKHLKIDVDSCKEMLKNKELEVKQLEQKLESMNLMMVYKDEEMRSVTQELIDIKRENRKIADEKEKYRIKQAQINDYLFNLEHEIHDVYKIVEDKEKSEESLINQVEQKDTQIDRLKYQILQLQNIIRNLQLTLQNNQKQLTLQKNKINQSSILSSSIIAHSLNQINQKNSPTSSQQSSNQQLSQSLKQKQLYQRLLTHQSLNKDLIIKNKQLISLVNKNATNMILLQKQKIQLLKFKEQIELCKVLKKQMKEQKEKLVKLEKENKKLSEENKKIKQEDGKQVQEGKQRIEKLQEEVKLQQNKILELIQQKIKINQNFIGMEEKSRQLNKKFSDIEIKYNKLTKEKKLLQQTQKILQKKNKTYQALVVEQQANIQANDIMAKQLEQKLNMYELYGANQNESLKNSNRGGESQIQLQSEISKSVSRSLSRSHKNIQNNKATPLESKKPSQLTQQKNSTPLQSSLVVKNLLTQIQELKQQLSVYKLPNSKQACSFSFQQNKAKLQTLIQLIQSYLQNKSYQKKDQLTQFLQQTIDMKLIDEDSRSYEVSFTVKKVKEIYKELVKYKAKIVKEGSTMLSGVSGPNRSGINKNSLINDNKNSIANFNSSIVSEMIQSLKPMQNAINELIDMAQS